MNRPELNIFLEMINLELQELEHRQLTETNLAETIREVQDLKRELGKLGIHEQVVLDCELLNGE